MTEEKFFERLRGDAAPLRYEGDPVALSRIRARIRERIAAPTVAQLIASWLRPLGAALTAVAIAAAIGIASFDAEDTTVDLQPVEIVMAGETYRVGE